jgi:hypothetical protein
VGGGLTHNAGVIIAAFACCKLACLGHCEEVPLLLGDVGERRVVVRRTRTKIQKMDSPFPSVLSLQECFFKAARLGDLAMLKLTLDNGADVNGTTSLGFTALTIAARNGHVPVIKLLVKRKACVEFVDCAGRTALNDACESGNVAVARRLIRCGATVDHVDKSGRSPLMHVVSKRRGSVDIATLLINSGADITLRSESGKSLLTLARRAKNTGVERLLLDALPKVETTFLLKWMFAMAPLALPICMREKSALVFELTAIYCCRYILGNC